MNASLPPPPPPNEALRAQLLQHPGPLIITYFRGWLSPKSKLFRQTAAEWEWDHVQGLTNGWTMTWTLPGMEVVECQFDDGNEGEEGEEPAMPHTVHVDLEGVCVCVYVCVCVCVYVCVYACR